MRDMFDEFLKELAERQREAERKRGAERTGPDEPAESGDGEPVEGEAAEVEGGELEGGEAPAEASDGAAPEGAEEEPGTAEPGEPVPPEPRVLFGRGGRPPRRRGTRAAGGHGRGRRVGTQALVAIVVALLLGIVLLLGSGIDLVTDAIWYASVQYDSVFWTRLGYQVVLFLAGTGIVLAILLFNLWLAGRLAPPPAEGGAARVRGLFGRLGDAARTVDLGPTGRDMFFGGRSPRGVGEARLPQIEFEAPDIPDLSPLAIVALVMVAALASLGVGATLAGSWDTIALWQHQVAFSVDGATVTDPIFGRDVSYFLFELPFLRLLQATAGAILIASLVVTGGRYLAAAARGATGIPTPVRVHLGVLGGLFLLIVAAGYQLDKLELVYSTHDFGTSVGFVGVGFTDKAARFFALDAMTIVAGLVAALLVGGAFTRWLWPAGAGIVVWIGLSLLLGGVYPEVIQRFTVDPNEFAQEQPYIANNIRMTRLAFDIDGWEDRSYRGDTPLTAAALQDEAATFQNARLWDYRPLQQTLDQLQTVRQYYDFFDVDVDRYPIGDETRQVMLSARELAPEKNPQAGSWVNQRIIFTHGFGLTMVPVNEVDDQGLPKLIIKDLPPVASSGAPEVTEPRIYFGERPSDWVLVGAKQSEFDYPTGGQQAGSTTETGQDIETRWTGTTGIRVDSLLTRLLFAARFRDLNLLITDQVTSDSQILVNRSLRDRLKLIAPFLVYDKDPYLVVGDTGRLVYVQDAYTVSDRFPNAQWFDGGGLGQGSGFAGTAVNYVRNSVKVVMDAYDGRMTFYVADPTDPLVQAWSGVFPSLFRPLDEMPAALRSHLRVPEEQFNVQTRMFARYHVTDESTFYQNNDLWMVPQNAVSSDTGQLPLEAYYVYMRMPGEPDPEFLLLQPMVPEKRPNMIAWVAARNDQPNYGGVRVYRFPRDTSIFGPVQIEARIDQNPQISSQLTLWSQAGSNVIRGNLIVIPVQDSIIYLEPIYLQSTGSAIPEFTRIVVASPTTVVWGRTLEEALYLLLGEQPGPSPSPSAGPTPGPSASPGPTATPGGSPLPADVDALVRYANEHFELAQAALRAGDFARYGEEIEKVSQALAQLEVLAGPTPVP